MVKNPPANAGDIIDESSILGSGKIPEGGNGNPLQYSCLENLIDGEAWCRLQSMDCKESDTTSLSLSLSRVGTSSQTKLKTLPHKAYCIK